MEQTPLVAAEQATSTPPLSTFAETGVKDAHHSARLQRALELPVELSPSAFKSSPSEIESALKLFELHNSSMKVSGGHMIKARVLAVDRRKITLDAGVKVAKIAVSDITPECILEQAPSPDATPRSHGQILPGDVVQVFLEHEETPEGDMLVSGQQAAVRRRSRAVWRELLDRLRDGQPVKGRVLNSLGGGFAVGVGGLVCFLPSSAATRVTTRRIGELQEFRVTQMNIARNNVVLADWRVVRGARGMYNNKNKGNPNRPQQQQGRDNNKHREVVAAADDLKVELEGSAPAAAPA